MKEKPFRDALRMQLASAGNDQKALRAIADTLIAAAMNGDVQAAWGIRDTLDGKPAQESTVTIDERREIYQYSDGELLQILKEKIDKPKATNGAMH